MAEALVVQEVDSISLNDLLLLWGKLVWWRLIAMETSLVCVMGINDMLLLSHDVHILMIGLPAS